MRGAADGVHVLMYFRGACSTSHAFACLCTTPAGTRLHVLGRGKAGPGSAQPRIQETGWRGRQDYVPNHAVGVFVWVVFRTIMAPRTLSATKA
jgi:hypothetical protein